MYMDAKCPKCSNIAFMDDQLAIIKCTHCGFKSTYDEYIGIMKEIAATLSYDYIPNNTSYNKD